MKTLYRLLGSLLKGVAVAGINTTSWGFYYQPNTPQYLKQSKERILSIEKLEYSNTIKLTNNKET